MIYDKVENIESYLGMSPNLDAAILEIKEHYLEIWPAGRHEIKDDSIYCNVVHAETKNESVWERHKQYLDIHIVISGNEIIRCANFKDVNGWNEYNYIDDYSLAPFSSKGIDIPLIPGWFLIIFPQDAHISLLRNNSEYSDKKIYKVKI